MSDKNERDKAAIEMVKNPTPKVKVDLEEAFRRFQHPTPEEQAEDDRKLRDALMRAHEADYNEDEPVQPFKCPFCGSDEYVPQTRVTNGRLVPGGSSRVQDGYKCAKCSIKFDDPAAFSEFAKKP